MNQKQAIKTAIECINKCRQNIAWDANMYSKGGQKNYRQGEIRYKQYQKYQEAIQVLKGIGKQGVLFGDTD